MTEKREEEVIRPFDLDSYIGQGHNKKVIKVSLLSSLKRKTAFPHTLMYGPPGLGKTTLAQIIADEMHVNYFSVMSTALNTVYQLENLLLKIPTDGYDNKGNIINPDIIHPTVIFIDEIHLLKKELRESLHSILEDFIFTVQRKDFSTGGYKTVKYRTPVFTLIGATNYLGSLPKPFVDRFKLLLQFEIYSDDEIAQILSFTAERLELTFDPKAIELLASRSRGVPRIANKFLLFARDVACALYDTQHISVECVEEMFNINNIDKYGLTRLDRKVLSYLAEVKRPIGLGAIAQAVDEDKVTIENSVEPWLVRQHLVVRTPNGRQITEEGLKHIANEFPNRNELFLIE
ncbi:MAG: Holliday junction DNA helicase RuvB C-terminal domain-containing protein [Candidatus Njordarchaeia archaeon]